MSYICGNPESHAGKSIGNGQCVIFVQACAKAPQADTWRQGVKVRGATNIKKGTAIATFFDGRYPNKKSGNHAAIYIRQTASAIYVWDQWVGAGNKRQVVHERPIRFRGGTGTPSDDGDTYYVIE